MKSSSIEALPQFPAMQIVDCISAGNGAVDAGARLRPPVNLTSGRSSDLYLHCGCAEIISECQLHNGMDIFCLLRECI